MKQPHPNEIRMLILEALEQLQNELLNRFNDCASNDVEVRAMVTKDKLVLLRRFSIARQQVKKKFPKLTKKEAANARKGLLPINGPKRGVAKR